jgi:Zn ribbon nucleic-acid-binding protein
MTERKRFVLDILCPNCGATGDAQVSENGDAEMPAAAFRVEAYPAGFAEEKRSASREETLVRCSCGQTFYLL